MIVYKYMKIEHVKDSIKNGIYAAPLNTFNDPYECKGIRYLDDYRVCCLTGSSRQMIMWAYYGNHKGCCVSFEIPDKLEIVKEINYTKEYYNHTKMSNEELVDILYTKAYEWNHEKEIRIVYNSEDSDKSLWNYDNDKVYFKGKVREVNFGLNVDFKEKNCQELLKYLSMNEEYYHIIVNQCRLSDSRYEIVKDKQFNYKKEII